MYDYRKMTPEERAEAVAARQARGWPWHGPPHLDVGVAWYMISAACYEDHEILATAARLSDFATALLSARRRSRPTCAVGSSCPITTICC